MAKKLLVKSPGGEREVRLVGTMAVGRDPGCAVSDADPLLSRRHAEFVVSREQVLVRDLDSRNGIEVNGVKVTEAVLQPGDRVEVAHLSFTYLDEADQHVPPPCDDAIDDATVAVPMPPDVRRGLAAAAARHARTPAPSPPPEPPIGPAAEPPPPVPVDAAGVEVASPDRPSDDMTGSTRLIDPKRAVAAGPVVRRSMFRRRTRAPVAATKDAAPRRARAAHVSWRARVLLLAIALAVVSVLLTAIPLGVARANLLEATGVARATAMLNWLAAEAGVALQTQGDLNAAAARVSREPGVVTAVVLSPAGRVLVPAARSGETVDRVPSVGIAPGDVRRTQHAVRQGLVEITCPVLAVDGRRLAVVWLTFRPAIPPETTGGIGLLGLLLVAVSAAIAVAMIIQRTTLRPLATLNEDLELAVAGQLGAVKDPLGAKATTDLAATLNYLLTRLRAGGPPAASAEPGDAHASRAGSPAAPGPPAQAGPVAAVETGAPDDAVTVSGQIMTDAQYRVTEVSSGAATLLGIKPDAAVGRHLVYAIPDRQVLDELLAGLGRLLPNGEHQVRVPLDGRPYLLDLLMTQASKDQPLIIRLNAVPMAERT